ncbi:MAG: integrase [Pseudomonadota bacterium]
MSAALTERLVCIARQAREAGHGGKAAVYAAACAELGMSRATLLRRLREVAVCTPRKRRADAGAFSLGEEEARMISAVLTEATRKNGKRIMGLGTAVDMLRANGVIRAEIIDEATGEVRPLSASAILRALRGYGLHPGQLDQPEPVTELRSLHPNHVWQIDASLCVLYYLPREGKDSGLRVADHATFYKNKPANVQRIERDRVWRYVITDHATGSVYVEYVFGGETGANLVDVFIHAVTQRAGEQMYGVPFLVMLDPGAANTGALFRSLCEALGVTLQINTPGRPRAKGQVEQAQNLVETQFESRLKFAPPPATLEELNALAATWRTWFNATRKHGRHGHTRWGLWQTIRQEHLRIAPAPEVLRDAATTAPTERTVQPKLRVSWRGEEFDVSCVDGLRVGDKVRVVTNPWRPDTIQLVTVGEDGQPLRIVCPMVEKDAYGFTTEAPVIGESYARHADTPAQTEAKRIERLVTGAATLEAADAARKENAVPFGGAIDPFKEAREASLPNFMPRRGTAMQLPDRLHVEQKPLTHIEMAAALRPQFSAAGMEWGVAQYQRMAALYPDGVMEEQLPEVAKRLREPESATTHLAARRIGAA